MSNAQVTLNTTVNITPYTEEKLISFMKENFSEIDFEKTAPTLKANLVCVSFSSEHFHREVAYELSQIEGITILFDEPSNWADNEFDLIATKGNLLLSVHYELPQLDDKVALVNIDLYTGTALDVSMQANQLAKELLKTKLQNDAQALFNLMLRNNNLMTSECFDVLSAGFEFKTEKNGASKADEAINLVGMVAGAIKQANNTNRMISIESMAPNIRYVSFLATRESDDQGGFYTCINDYDVRLTDGTSIILPYGENHLDEYIKWVISANEEILPENLKNLLDSDLDDDAQHEALTQYFMSLFGGVGQDAFWLLSNTFDSLIWDAAANGGVRITFSDITPQNDSTAQ